MSYELILKAAQALVEQVPDSMINMKSYQDKKGGVTAERLLPCKTCACFAGHMPFLGVPGLEPDFLDYTNERRFSFEKYSSRILGAHSSTRVWSFIFSSVWPNSGWEIFRRAAYLVANKEAPAVWESEDGNMVWNLNNESYIMMTGLHYRLVGEEYEI